ncbi:MAG: nuclease [Planctomycetes bacterium]|nr:nuclease [Planctomycetota bacterium]
MICILVDYREKNSDVFKLLSGAEGVSVPVRNLYAGDYVVNGIGIERKTTADFGASLIDGRLFNQLEKLKNTYNRALLIIEGKDFYCANNRIRREALKGALMSILLRWQMPVIFSEDSAETTQILLLAASAEERDTMGFCRRHGYRPKSKRKRKLFILQGLPGIGPALADILLNHFGSVRNVFTACQEELTSAPGIGRGKADKIHEILDEYE